jgi:tetratricopeptide (TPR) repeat protein
MSSAPTCRTCGSPLSAAASGPYCPACLLGFAASTEDPTPESETTGSFPRPFGDYELLTEVGRGGMGLVFKARQRSLDRVVALKVLLTGRFSDETARRRFRLEAESAAKLQHPNIVTIFEVGEAEGHPYLTMDFVDGPNLATRIDGRPLPARMAAQLLRDVARAVQVAHAAGVLHRDLKPSNILVGPDQRPRVTDFGIAKRHDVVEGLTVAGQVLGSPNYASPEQAAGRNQDVGIPSDVYGLGALLYHLVTGRAPFNAPTAAETLRLVLDTEPASPRLLNPALAHDLETICLKCLQKDPARRYPSAEGVADELDRFLNDQAILARPISKGELAWRWCRRHPVLAVLPATAIVALAVTTVIFNSSARRIERAHVQEQAARAQAEELVGVIMHDVQPALEPYGRLPVMGKIAEASLHYFERLPLELQSAATDAAQATALDSLALISEQARDNEPARARTRRALALWEKVVAARPDDPDATAALLLDELRRIHWLGPRTYEEQYRMLADLVARGRQMRVRFPDHQRIKYALASALTYWSYHAASGGEMEGTLAGAREAQTLLRDLLVQLPGDANVQSTYVTSFASLGAVYSRTGDTASCIRAGEQAAAFAEEVLKKDPGNLILLEAAAHAARGLAARGHLEMLIQLDPANRRWRFLYAQSFFGEADHLRRDGQIASACLVYAKIGSLMQALGDLRLLRPDEGPGGPLGAILDADLEQAECAALAGDPVGARALLEAAAPRFQTLCESVGRESLSARFFALGYLDHRCRVADALHDWTELTRLAHETFDETDRGLRQVPGMHDFWGQRAAGRRFLGKALLRQGQTEEAIHVLQRSREELREVPADTTFYRNRNTLDTDINETLAEALTETGDVAEARKLLESALAAREANFQREPDLWEMKPNLARTAYLLARVLAPADAADSTRRAALLERAESLLSGPEAEPRLFAEERDLKTKIKELRGAAGFERGGRIGAGVVRDAPETEVP